MKIEFVDTPPAPNQGKKLVKRPKYYTIARTLRANPGKWAHIMRDKNSVIANSIKKGTLVSFRPANAFEAVSRTNENGKVDIYARFVGAADKADA